LGKSSKFKAIRKAVREHSNASSIAPEYQDTNVRVRGYSGGGVGAGEAPTTKLMTTSTLVLNKDSERGLRQAIKKQCKKNPHLMRSRLK